MEEGEQPRLQKLDGLKPETLFQLIHANFLTVLIRPPALELRVIAGIRSPLNQVSIAIENVSRRARWKSGENANRADPLSRTPSLTENFVINFVVSLHDSHVTRRAKILEIISDR